MPGARNTAENGNVWYFALLQELISGWKCARKQKFASKISNFFYRGNTPGPNLYCGRWQHPPALTPAPFWPCVGQAPPVRPPPVSEHKL